MSERGRLAAAKTMFWGIAAALAAFEAFLLWLGTSATEFLIAQAVPVAGVAKATSLITKVLHPPGDGSNRPTTNRSCRSCARNCMASTELDEECSCPCRNPVHGKPERKEDQR